MSWNSSPMEVQYQNNSMPYNSIGSFVDFFGGLTYDHVNYIFADVNYVQENSCPNLYKYAVSGPESFSYYEYGHGYMVNNHESDDEYCGHLENPSVTVDDHATVSQLNQEGNSVSSSDGGPLECPRNQHDTRDNEVIWQDNIDPDAMTYEELLELGEAVGTQSRGLSQDQIELLPISKFKWSLFSRKKYRERCVICQMEYKRGNRRIILPCKHAYHTTCGSRWLSINKACPICYKEVIVDVPKN